MNGNYQSGMRVSEYLLEDRLGAGSFGEVWRGRHHIWDKELVAIKLPTAADYVRHLQREGVVVHGLRHPNVVRVLGLDPYGDPPYLVMELVDGPSLRPVIDSHPQGLSLPLVHSISQGILRGLVAAHTGGVVHCDLKPSNVLLNLAGKPLEQLDVYDVKVSDFGLGAGDADTLRSIAQSVSLAREDSVVGTIAYMAPEVRDQRQQGDARSDLFSFGVLLFELLTGQRPAGAELPSTVRADAGHLDQIFRQLYARYDRRYTSAASVLQDLERTLVGQTAAPAASPTSAGYVRSCRDCGGKVDANDQFCIHCGTQLAADVRRCPSCDAYPAAEDRYCIFCGTTLSRSREA